MFILPYKDGSKSAKSLAQNVMAKVLRSTNTSRFFTSPILNWGNSERELASIKGILNPPRYVRNAVYKNIALRILKENNVAVPDFTTSYEEACMWIKDRQEVFARMLLNSHSGKGIVHCRTYKDIPEGASLYVKYFKKTYEFRVHIFNGKVIDYIQKRKRSDIDESMYNPYIRSHNNGWVFCREDILVKDHVKKLAVDAVKALRLDFGAVDIVMKQDDEAVVLEVNTAPALEQSTLEAYTQAVLNYDWGNV